MYSLGSCTTSHLCTVTAYWINLFNIPIQKAGGVRRFPTHLSTRLLAVTSHSMSTLTLAVTMQSKDNQLCNWWKKQCVLSNGRNWRTNMSLCWRNNKAACPAISQVHKAVMASKHTHVTLPLHRHSPLSALLLNSWSPETPNPWTGHNRAHLFCTLNCCPGGKQGSVHWHRRQNHLKEVKRATKPMISRYKD